MLGSVPTTATSSVALIYIRKKPWTQHTRTRILRSTRWTRGSVSYIKVTKKTSYFLLKNTYQVSLQFELFFSNDAQQVGFQTGLLLIRESLTTLSMN
mmetsp:Transcript_51663/g.137911  ORF Transcript_51663/g.137911 Transcript_51663/m.137911 type:complete len:97 (+) Transcript_51663:162-452(+)